jgi:antiviral helicase SLH1
MVIHDRIKNTVTVTELGGIAAKYYIRFESVEIFNREFKSKMSEADVFGMLSSSVEVGAKQSMTFRIAHLLIYSLIRYKCESQR